MSAWIKSSSGCVIVLASGSSRPFAGDGGVGLGGMGPCGDGPLPQPPPARGYGSPTSLERIFGVVPRDYGTIPGRLRDSVPQCYCFCGRSGGAGGTAKPQKVADVVSA